MSVLYFVRDSRENFCILKREDIEGFFVSPKNTGDDCEDIGPFDTFEAAAACFETLVGLD